MVKQISMYPNNEHDHAMYKCVMKRIKLDGVGPIDNIPSTDYLHNFVQKRKKKKKKKKW